MKESLSISSRMASLDWNVIHADLLENGFAVIHPFLTEIECRDLCRVYEENELYRSTIDMKRYNFGRGTYRYFKYPLPEIVQTLRLGLYENVASAANHWSTRLKLDVTYPKAFSEFKKMMEAKGQTKPTPLILRYQENDFNCLHQDLNSDLIFPYQVVFGLSELGQDYEGGHLILTQQRPRMQTVPHVLTIPKGGAVIFTSNFHAQKSSKGFYRSVFKHGVGKVLKGNRYTLGIVFHDYRDEFVNG